MKKEVITVLVFLLVVSVVSASQHFPEQNIVVTEDLSNFTSPLETQEKILDNKTPVPSSVPRPDPVYPVSDIIQTGNTDKYSFRSTKTAYGGQTVYEIEFSAKQDLENVEFIVDIPKELAADASLLTYVSMPYEVIEADPVIKIMLGEVEEGSNTFVTFKIDGDLRSLANPKILVNLEKKINPERNKTSIILFYSLAILLGLAIIFPRRLLRKSIA